MPKKNALRYVINTIINVVRGLTSFISRVLRHAENSGLWHNRLTRYTVPRGVALKRKRPKKRWKRQQLAANKAERASHRHGHLFPRPILSRCKCTCCRSPAVFSSFYYYFLHRAGARARDASPRAQAAASSGQVNFQTTSMHTAAPDPLMHFDPWRWNIAVQKRRMEQEFIDRATRLMYRCSTPTLYFHQQNIYDIHFRERSASALVTCTCGRACARTRMCAYNWKYAVTNSL